jgi:transposase
MKKGNEVFVGIDTAGVHNAVAVAEAGRDGEVRYLGTFDNTPDAVVRLVRKLAGRYEALHFCYEAGSTGHGLYWQILPHNGAKTTLFAPYLNIMYQKRVVYAPLCKAVENQRCGAACIYTCNGTT